MDTAAARQVGVTFEALLLEQALRPLARGCGALGTYGIGSIARGIAEHDDDGFAALIAAEMAHARE